MTQNAMQAKKSRSFAEQSVFVPSIPSSMDLIQKGVCVDYNTSSTFWKWWSTVDSSYHSEGWAHQTGRRGLWCHCFYSICVIFILLYYHTSNYWYIISRQSSNTGKFLWYHIKCHKKLSKMPIPLKYPEILIWNKASCISDRKSEILSPDKYKFILSANVNCWEILG